jgi:hypothetical protein
VGLDGVNEVVSVRLGKIFHAKVVNTEDEGYFLGVVAPKAWGEGRWLVASGCQLCYELVVESDDGRFLEALHTAPKLEIHIALGVDLDVVAWIVPDFPGDNRWWHPHVLEIGHGGAQKIVFLCQDGGGGRHVWHRRWCC